MSNINDENYRCPRCGGYIHQVRLSHGRVFYGCRNYPTCNYSRKVRSITLERKLKLERSARRARRNNNNNNNNNNM